MSASRAIGVRIVGRLAGVRDGKVQLSGSLRNVCELADLKLNRLLNTIDQWAAENGVDRDLEPVHRCAPTLADASPPLSLDPRGAASAPCSGPPGSARTLRLPFLRRRKSTLIDRVGDDARDLSAHLAAFVGARALSAGYCPPESAISTNS